MGSISLPSRLKVKGSPESLGESISLNDDDLDEDVDVAKPGEKTANTEKKTTPDRRSLLQSFVDAKRFLNSVGRITMQNGIVGGLTISGDVIEKDFYGDTIEELDYHCGSIIDFFLGERGCRKLLVTRRI